MLILGQLDRDISQAFKIQDRLFDLLQFLMTGFRYPVMRKQIDQRATQLLYPLFFMLCAVWGTFHNADQTTYGHISLTLPPLLKPDTRENQGVFRYHHVVKANNNIIIGPNRYYYYPYDSLLLSIEYGYPSAEKIPIPSLIELDEKGLRSLLRRLIAECPGYPLKFTMMRKARYGQMVHMLQLLRLYRFPKYALTRILDSEVCAVQDYEENNRQSKRGKASSF